MTINSAFDWQLVFEDVSGAYGTSDKVIDDVMISDGPCDPYTTTDFESSSNGWLDVSYCNACVKKRFIL